MSLPPIKFVKAARFREATRANINWVVLHSAETQELPSSAEGVANYFAHIDRDASAHYTVDSNSIVQSVLEKDVAFGAKGANRYGIHIEHAGRARQTEAEWLDDYGVKMLTLSAELVADICRRHKIIPQWLGPEDLKRGLRGLTTHNACRLAFGGTHTDPGSGFPYDWYRKKVLSFYDPLQTAPPKPRLEPDDPRWANVALPALRALYGMDLPADTKRLLDALRDSDYWPPR